MALISILPNGTTAGNPNQMGNKNPPQRSETVGWNYQVTRRLKKWFYSIPVTSLSGHGYAFTLTLKKCPKTSDEFAKLRGSYLKRLERLNYIRVQWLTEWQRRGVPHLHGIVYFDSEQDPKKLINIWCSLADPKYTAKSWAQDCKHITDVLGWLDYLAKHAGRSATHYQRSPENVPQGWKKTGRMWGARGNWEVREPMRFEIDQEGFYKYRRIAKSIYHSNVRERLNVVARSRLAHQSLQNLRESNKSQFKQYSQSKRVLKVSDKDLGRMMGVSDWIDQDDSIKIITWLGSQGHRVVQA